MKWTHGETQGEKLQKRRLAGCHKLMGLIAQTLS